MFRTLPIILIALTSASGCGNKKDVIQPAPPVTEAVPAAPPEERADTLWGKYERTVCFGMCPSFELKIYSDGHAMYEGRNFVEMIGFYHTTFDRASLQKIEDTLERINYFGFQDIYDNPRVTDLPTVTTGFYHNGKMKMVAARYHAPDALEEVYQVLDELIQDADWVPVARE